MSDDRKAYLIRLTRANPSQVQPVRKGASQKGQHLPRVFTIPQPDSAKPYRGRFASDTMRRLSLSCLEVLALRDFGENGKDSLPQDRYQIAICETGSGSTYTKVV